MISGDLWNEDMLKFVFIIDYMNVYSWILLFINRLSLFCEVLYYFVVSYGIFLFCRLCFVEFFFCVFLFMQFCGEIGFCNIFQGGIFMRKLLLFLFLVFFVLLVQVEDVLCLMIYNVCNVNGMDGICNYQCVVNVINNVCLDIVVIQELDSMIVWSNWIDVFKELVECI